MNATNIIKETAAFAREWGSAFTKELATATKELASGLLDAAFFLGLIGFGGKLLIDNHLGTTDSVQGEIWMVFAGLFLPFLCIFVPGLVDHAIRYYRMLIALTALVVTMGIAGLLWNYAHPIIGAPVGIVGIRLSMAIMVAIACEDGDCNDNPAEKWRRDDDQHAEKQRSDDDYYAEKQRRDDRNNETNLHSIQWRRP